jgi:regulatory protein
MSDEEPSAQARPARRDRPSARTLSPASLEADALRHLQRYAASVEQLRRVLTRRIERAAPAHGSDPAQAQQWLEALLAKLIRSGLLDDGAFAETKAHALRTAGQSARAITQRLLQQGVATELVEREVARAETGLPEREAARIWARKKRLGPYRQDPVQRAARRQRDLASLGRAGYSYEIAVEIIDGERDLDR